jgi:hypothetical protein
MGRAPEGCRRQGPQARGEFADPAALSDLGSAHPKPKAIERG